MSKFYNFKNFNNSLEVDYNFNYNRYEKKESLTSHRIIKNNITGSNNKEISLILSFKGNYNHDFARHRSQINIDYLKKLDNIKLEALDIRFFNMISEKYDFLEKNHKSEDPHIKKLKNVFNVSHLDFVNNFFDSRKITIDRNKVDYINKCNKSNLFFENDILFKNEEDELYTNKYIKKQYIENKNNFLSDFTHYNVKNIYGSPEVYHSFVGFLIEKYYKDDNDKYVSLENRFFLDRSLKNNNTSLDFFNRNSEQSTLTIKDVAIKYGSIYKYKVFPVYSMTFPAFNDFHVVNDYLICDMPFITNDIICKENTRPQPPSNIKFYYDHNKNKLNISWKLSPDTVGDIKGFQIFKRNNLDKPYSLIKQIEFHNEDDLYERNDKISSIYIETREEIESFEYYDNFRKDITEIYAICSIDAHGFVSNYSSQIGVNYNHATRKVEIDLVSREGAPINMPNILIDRKTKFFDNENNIVTSTPIEKNIEKISIYATPDFATINVNDLESNRLIYKEKYKFDIFKLENNENFTDTIKINNFRIE